MSTRQPGRSRYVVTAESWQPISVDALRVGHFVRIGHHWYQHPFVLSRFRITSDQDIAIIRRSGITRLFIDPARSAVPEQAPDSLVETPGAVQETPADVAVVAEQMQSRKAAHTAKVRRHRDHLIQTQESYRTAVDDFSVTLGLLASGRSAAGDSVDALVHKIVATATGSDSPLTFAAITHPDDAAQRRACLGLDAAAIAAAVGRRMRLTGEDMTTLTASAMLHAIGMEQLPEALREEGLIRSREDILEFQHYPLLGSAMLRECRRFPVDVLRVVRQHRERLDGSGFPESASAEEIHPFASIVGAIREFQVHAAREAAMVPAAAVAHLYRNLRGAYGATAVDNVIAALTVYPPGAFLALSDGSIGRVMRVSDTARLRPMVCLFDETVAPGDAQIVDLAETADISVARVLDPAALQADVRSFFGSGWAGLALSPAAALPA